jgi:hypothetical protein
MRIFQPTVTGSNTTTGSLHISGPVYFYTLETSSVFHVLTYNTSSGQVFYTASDAIGKKPGEPDQSIQFNDGGDFSGSINFTFNGTDIVYLTGSMLVSGAISASYGSDTVGFYGTASWAQSASNALFAQTASFITASNVWGPFGSSSVASASFASSSISASYAETASLAYTALFITASNVWGIFGSSSVDSASFASSSISASYAETASFILNPYPIDVTGSSLYSVAPVAGIPNIPINNNSIFFGSGAGNQASSASNSNFLGYDAGANTTEAINSNFLGDSAGQLADKANDSNFLGYQAGYNANTASNSNFLGREAGYNSDFTTQSNFIGYQAGYQADNAYNSNFLGYRAGRLIRDAYNSNFIGYEAGSQQSANNTSSYNSNFIGYQVGKNTNNIYNSNFIGYKAGTDADFSPYSNFLGYEAGYSAFSASYSNFIGYNAGYNSDLSSHSVFIGYQAGSGAPTSSNSNFIGYRAGYAARNSNNSIFIGYEAGREVNNSSHSIFIGYQAGKELDTGGVDYVGPNNIIIGTNVTLPVSSQNSINIGGLIFATGSNSNTTPVTPTFTPAGGNVGINIYPPLYNFHVSGTVAFPNLTTSSQINVVVIDTASGQLYYTSSTSVGGGGGGTPAPSDTYIQFNSASVFKGDSAFRYLYQSQSLQQGSFVTASGLYSHAEGLASKALGAYSHAEGNSTYTGMVNGYSASISSGVVTLWENYGDVTSEFNIGDYLAFTDATSAATGQFSPITNVTFTNPNTIITLANNVVNYSKVVVGNISVLPYNWLGDQTIGFDYTHAEGTATVALGVYSHAEGYGTVAGAGGSHTEGNQTVAIADYQSVTGQFNALSLSQSAFIIGDGDDVTTRHNVLFVSKAHFEVSASNTYLQGLPYLTSSFILTYDSSSGQVYFASSSTVGGGAAGNPAPPTNSIQFNNDGAFGGSEAFTFISASSTAILTGSLITSGSTQTIGTALFTGSILATGSVDVKGFITASKILITSSGVNQLTVIGSGSNPNIVNIFGSQGNLLTVNDSLSGSIFAVSDISGRSILDVQSNSTVLLGNYQAPALFTTTQITTTTGVNTIYSIPTSSYDGAFFDYTLISGINARAGQIMSIWSGSEIRHTETTTTDIGSTSEFIFSVALTAGSASLQVTGSTGAIIKTIIKGI